jgi:hypothetical protein
LSAFPRGTLAVADPAIFELGAPGHKQGDDDRQLVAKIKPDHSVLRLA